MPLQWAHPIYWKARDNPPPAAAPAVPGYPAWQAAPTVAVGSLFGGLQAGWEWVCLWWADLRYWWAWRPRLRALAADERAVLESVALTLQRDDWPAARQAVITTSHTPRFNRPESWIPYSRMVKANQGRACNLFRRVRAETLLEEAVGNLPPAERMFLVELAYHAYGVLRH